MTLCHLFFIVGGDTVSLCKGGQPLPKQTFYNLPQGKKETLLHAVEKEFSRVPLHEASIANIVKTANIPRGSFYQYFKNKEDAYFYLLNERIEAKKKRFLGYLKEHDGNLFEAVTLIYEQSIYEEANEEGLQFLKNTLLNMTHEIEDKFSQIFNVNGTVEQFSELKQLINTDNLTVQDKHDLFHLVQLLAMVIVHNLVEKYAKNLTFDEAVENFSIQINLLKTGLVKNNVN